MTDSMKALPAASGLAGATPGMKKGGQVKPRGVGIARKGHGKGTMR